MLDESTNIDQVNSKFDADNQAEQRDDVDEQSTRLPTEVTDQLMDGSDQVFLAAFKNAQADGLSRDAALSVAWNSIKQGFYRTQEGSWHRKETPDDNVISSGAESSAS
jgi:cation transport regulator